MAKQNTAAAVRKLLEAERDRVVTVTVADVEVEMHRPTNEVAEELLGKVQGGGEERDAVAWGLLRCCPGVDTLADAHLLMTLPGAGRLTSALLDFISPDTEGLDPTSHSPTG